MCLNCVYLEQAKASCIECGEVTLQCNYVPKDTVIGKILCFSDQITKVCPSQNLIGIKVRDEEG